MGLFITFEGPEGSGKTTQAQLLAEYLEDQGHTVNLTREPGGTSISEKIRELLLDPDHGNMDTRTELLLYLASRSQHVSERIRPALDRNEIVICDRFTDASVVYQGIGRNLGTDRVR
jgi:dTMP kinase